MGEEAEPQTQQNLRGEVSAAPGTTHLKLALPSHPTSNTQLHHRWPENWRTPVCTHRKHCLVRDLQLPNLIPSPQPKKFFRKEVRTSSLLASETSFKVRSRPQTSEAPGQPKESCAQPDPRNLMGFFRNLPAGRKKTPRRGAGGGGGFVTSQKEPERSVRGQKKPLKLLPGVNPENFTSP